jgi:hypothetical protein
MKTRTIKHAMKCFVMVFISIFLFSNCASIATQTEYPLSINSSPEGAKVTITNKKGTEVFVGNTPANIELKSSSGFFSKAEYQVKFSLSGYNDKTVTVSSKIDGWYWGNILIGGLVGMLIIDPATGAMWQLDTQNVYEELVPLKSQNDNMSLKIMDIKDIPNKWRDHLITIK